MPVRVLLADDNALFREGVAQILSADGRFEVVAQASSGLEAVASAATARPQLILIDLRMPGGGGVEAIRRIRSSDPDVRIGVLTVFEAEETVEAALRAGAQGYITKNTTPARLLEAALQLSSGSRSLVLPERAARTARSTDRSPGLDHLTPKEREVLRALAGRSTSGAIARSLGISPKTLRNHISNLYEKLDIHDRAQAVIVALREGLVDPHSEI